MIYSRNKFDFLEVTVAVTEDGVRSGWALALETRRRVAKGARGRGPPGPTEELAESLRNREKNICVSAVCLRIHRLNKKAIAKQ